MLRAGTYLQERYEILELIGSGGMSDVYKAKCHKLNRYVAIKVLKDEFSSDEGFVSKFKMEAQAAACLSHPNIVSIYDVVDEGKLHYIVMELIEGITLKSYIAQKRRLDVKEAVSISIQVAQGIAAAHSRNIVHRDIKPQNIIISKDGKVKVADFGIARAATSQTITVSAVGSVHYISPEQARGGYSDARSDIYSFGITMYEMVTGRVPFEGDNTVTVALAHLEEPITRPSVYNPQIPVSLENIILKCTEKKPEHRYRSVEEVIADADHSGDWIHRLASIAIIDENQIGKWYHGVPVVATYDNMFQYVKEQIVDEVFISVPYETGDSLAEVVNRFEDMGATVHVTIEILNKFDDYHKTFNMLGNIPVVTFSNQSYDWKMLMIKRVMDIAGSIVGLVITAVVTVFLAPPLLIESPGPLFFAQKRVGKNGRFFKIYKFRSMYKDAEERKKELESQNEMNGLMFKMKDDPRITKVGKFIRKTSIDELPQFFNVLKGDMSLVGTRPPTVDEFKQYESHQKRRLSAKPGITGLWQVSGRNEITDFEDVVKLDVQYIDNWSLGLDIKIILKTIKVVFEKGGE